MKKSKSKAKKPKNHSKTLYFRQNKELTALYIILRLIIIFIFTLDIIRGKYESAMTCGLTLILMLIPSFIDRSLHIELPSLLETIMLLFVFSANILGEIGSFYEKIPFLDTILHTLNGFICAGVGFGLTDILNSSKKVKFNLSPVFVCMFSFCFSMTAGTVWEFFEFGVDSLLSKDMQKDTVITAINSTLLSGNETNTVTHINEINSTLVNGNDLGINGYLDIGLIDTMKDLFVNFLGAIVFNGVGFIYLKNRGKKASFLSNFIPRKSESSAVD